MPVARRRVRDEDEELEEDEAPKRRRPRDEDDEPEEKPRKRRAARDDDDDGDDEERPAKKKRRARDEDEDDEEDDEDEDGESRKRPVGSVRKGWKGAKENQLKGGDFPDEMKITDEAELVKFLEDEPFASYRQHWVDNPPAGIKKKSYTCLEDDCALCDMGDRPRTLTAFNVLHLSTGGAAENKILILGNKAVGQLQGFADDPKTGPLDRLFWAISKSGKKQSTAYNFQPVKERDLEEDWEIDPEDVAQEIEDAQDRVYDHTAIQVPTKRQLRELVEGLLDEDD